MLCFLFTGRAISLYFFWFFHTYEFLIFVYKFLGLDGPVVNWFFMECLLMARAFVFYEDSIFGEGWAEGVFGFGY